MKMQHQISRNLESLCVAVPVVDYHDEEVDDVERHKDLENYRLDRLKGTFALHKTDRNRIMKICSAKSSMSEALCLVCITRQRQES